MSGEKIYLFAALSLLIALFLGSGNIGVSSSPTVYFGCPEVGTAVSGALKADAVGLINESLAFTDSVGISEDPAISLPHYGSWGNFFRTLFSALSNLFSKLWSLRS